MRNITILFLSLLWNYPAISQQVKLSYYEGQWRAKNIDLVMVLKKGNYQPKQFDSSLSVLNGYYVLKGSPKEYHALETGVSFDSTVTFVTLDPVTNKVIHMKLKVDPGTPDIMKAILYPSPGIYVNVGDQQKLTLPRAITFDKDK